MQLVENDLSCRVHPRRVLCHATASRLRCSPSLCLISLAWPMFIIIIIIVVIVIVTIITWEVLHCSLLWGSSQQVSSPALPLRPPHLDWMSGSARSCPPWMVNIVGVMLNQAVWIGAGVIVRQISFDSPADWSRPTIHLSLLSDHPHNVVDCGLSNWKPIWDHSCNFWPVWPVWLMSVE